MTDPANSPPDNHIMIDVLHRLRTMEQNLPPRVQTLEAAVTEIQKEFRGMRQEQVEQATETRAALNAFRDTMQRYDLDAEQRRKEQAQDTASIKKALTDMGRKISFASGALWAAGGLFTLSLAAVYNWQKIAPLIAAVAQGVPTP